MILVLETTSEQNVVLDTRRFALVFYGDKKGQTTAFYCSTNDNEPILAKLPFAHYVELRLAHAARDDSNIVMDLRHEHWQQLKEGEA